MRKKKRRYDTGGVKGPSTRRWLRDLSVSTPWRDTESTTCRNATCTNEVASDGLSHGFCESCWNSKVRVLPGTSDKAPAHAANGTPATRTPAPPSGTPAGTLAGTATTAGHQAPAHARHAAAIAVPADAVTPA